jgi:hypothetical protein
MGYSVAWRKFIHEKNLKSKSSWHCPLKRDSFFLTIAVIAVIWG